MILGFSSLAVGTLIGVASAAASSGSVIRSEKAAPRVELSYGTFQGLSGNTTESFLGIPFAQPPVGDLRFRLPRAPTHFSGVRNATTFSNACPQQVSVNYSRPTGIPGLNLSIVPTFIPSNTANPSEDCLYLNVIRPSGMSMKSKLPVVVWIYGGGFHTGDASSYDGVPVVERSIALDEPIIYVSLNYRLHAFGFLPGKEAKKAGIGNLGLHDQRLALQWVQEHIPSLGGDPRRVIVWGQSAGSMSATAQMAAFDGKGDPLFHGGVLESGFTLPIRDITATQSTYDLLVNATNCSVTTTKFWTSAHMPRYSSTLDCLRAAPYETIMAVVNSTAPSADKVWQPTVDGVFLKRTLREAFEKGLHAKVPIIAGDCDDEGTLFSLYTQNVTTDQTFLNYIQDTYLFGANDSQVARVGEAYSADPSLGSPFNTGNSSAFTPEYKRISAFRGDWTFQGPRRFMIRALSKKNDVWAYISKRNKGTPLLGSFHGTDIQEFYALFEDTDYVGTDALINFAYNLDPNFPRGVKPKVNSALANISWPRWTNDTSTDSTLRLLTLEDPKNLTIGSDDYRVDAMEILDTVQTELGL